MSSKKEPLDHIGTAPSAKLVRTCRIDRFHPRMYLLIACSVGHVLQSCLQQWREERFVRIGKAPTAKGFRSFRNDPQLTIACVGCVLQRMLRQNLYNTRSTHWQPAKDSGQYVRRQRCVIHTTDILN
jgi:hypothetical protein